MSDHIEGDTEIWSSKYIFGNKIIQNKKITVSCVVVSEGLTEADSGDEKIRKWVICIYLGGMMIGIMCITLVDWQSP